MLLFTEEAQRMTERVDSIASRLHSLTYSHATDAQTSTSSSSSSLSSSSVNPSLSSQGLSLLPVPPTHSSSSNANPSTTVGSHHSMHHISASLLNKISQVQNTYLFNVVL